jgi:eukaryotic-like serine/threonine-protein kinase
MTDWRDQGADDAEPEALSMFPPGALIAGKYRIEHLIGRGGMGSVWAATHIGLGQLVAVKLISRRYATSREARQRFDMEAKAVAQLRSRHVVQVFDNGETEDGTPYIAMELLEGESLDQRIAKGGPMPVDAVVRIANQVSRALTRAHAVGIVHRDLKPENIFLTHSQDDDEEIAKVLDFGIAKIKRTDGSNSSSTRTGAVLGTPLFMSPEQARGLKTVDHRTDVYSLGMVIYMMLTGRPAISGDSFGDILVAICTQPLPPICSVAPWLPPSFEAWFQRACAREPGDRFQTPEQLMEGLAAAAGGRPIAFVSQQLAVAPQQPGAAWQTGPGVGGPIATQGPAGQGFPTGQTTSSAVYVSADQIPRRSLVVPFLATLGAVLVMGAIVAVVILRNEGPARDAASSASSLAAVSATPVVPPLPPPAPPPASASAAAAAAEAPPVAAAPAKVPAKTSKGPALAAPAPTTAKAKAPGGKQPPTKKPPGVDLGF